MLSKYLSYPKFIFTVLCDLSMFFFYLTLEKNHLSSNITYSHILLICKTKSNNIVCIYKIMRVKNNVYISFVSVFIKISGYRYWRKISENILHAFKRYVHDCVLEAIRVKTSSPVSYIYIYIYILELVSMAPVLIWL